MQLRLRSFIWAVVAVSNLSEVISVTQLRQSPAAGSEPAHAAGAGDAAKAFAKKASRRLQLLSQAAQQVLVTPSVQQEPTFRKSLHKVSAQLQESATILQKWGADYARNADAHEMAVTLAEQGEAYEAQDLKKQLRAAIEADQEARLEQPKRLAELAKKVAGLRTQLNHMVAEEAPKKGSKAPISKASKKAGTALISNVWPKPPKNASKAEIGLFMHDAKMKVGKSQREEEDQSHLVKLETRLNSLEAQLQEAHAAVAASHVETLEAHREAQEDAKK